jgi:hypothetical protein
MGDPDAAKFEARTLKLRSLAPLAANSQLITNQHANKIRQARSALVDQEDQ